MARRKNRGEWVEDEPGLDISSLIDVCFLLLIYFLIATTIQRVEEDVNMRLPSAIPASDADITEIQPMFIKIEPSGAVYVGPGSESTLMDSDADDRTVPNLTAELQTYKAACDLAQTSPVIQVKISEQVKQQRVIDVLNAISGVEIKRVTFTDFVEE